MRSRGLGPALQLALTGHTRAHPGDNRTRLVLPAMFLSTAPAPAGTPKSLVDSVVVSVDSTIVGGQRGGTCGRGSLERGARPWRTAKQCSFLLALLSVPSAALPPCWQACRSSVRVPAAFAYSQANRYVPSPNLCSFLTSSHAASRRLKALGPLRCTCSRPQWCTPHPYLFSIIQFQLSFS